MVTKIKANEFSQVQNAPVAVVDFSATWCGPCKMLAPVLEKVAQEYAGKAAFFNIDVDEAPALAQQYGITSIPALLVLKNGQLADSHIGFAPQPAVSAFVARNL